MSLSFITYMQLQDVPFVFWEFSLVLAITLFSFVL